MDQLDFWETAFQCLNIRFYDLIDKRKSAKKILDVLNTHQGKRILKKGHKKGGINENTKAVFRAVLALIPPTMEHVKKTQPEVFAKAVIENQPFALVYRSTLIDKIAEKLNNLKLSPGTITNHLNKLIELEIFEKRNHNIVRDQTTGDLIDPRPIDENPNGRGKLKLTINKKYFCKAWNYRELWNSAQRVLSQTLAQYQFLSSSNSTLNKSIINRGKQQIKAVSATADVKSLNKRKKEQGRKSPLKIKGIRPKISVEIKGVVHLGNKKINTNRTEKQDIEEILNQASVLFFHGRPIAPDDANAVAEMLNQAEELVQQYRTKQVNWYTQKEKYQAANPKQQRRWLDRFSVSLPSHQQGAVEILTHALTKQYKHAKKYGYLGIIGRSTNTPAALLRSSNMQFALRYSFQDWQKYTRLDDCNGYWGGLKACQSIHTRVKRALYEKGTQSAYSYAVKEWKRYASLVVKQEDLPEAQKKALLASLKLRLRPLFSGISNKDKQEIKTAA